MAENCGNTSGANKGGDMLYSVDSDKPLQKIHDDLLKACADHKFGVLGVHNLKEKMREKGVEYNGECLVFEVCNPQTAKVVLEANPEISTALPCRISVFKGKEGKMRLSTIRPTLLLGYYRSLELEKVGCEVEKSLVSIINQAAR